MGAPSSPSGGRRSAGTLPNLTARMLERGYSDSDVRKVIEGNWQRIMAAVWG